MARRRVPPGDPRVGELVRAGWLRVAPLRNEDWRGVARLAAGLQELGIRDGARAAILAVNSDHYLEFVAATLWAGGVFTQVSGVGKTYKRPKLAAFPSV